LLLCSGRVSIDLAVHPLAEQTREQVAIARVEQLSPLPRQELARLLESYPRLEAVVWVQEEPRNMGAWDYLHPDLAAIVHGRCTLQCISRPAASSPAEGSTSRYVLDQHALVERAFGAATAVPKRDASPERP